MVKAKILNFRNSLFLLHVEALLILLVMAFLVVAVTARSARAETTRHTRSSTTTTVESDDEGLDNTAPANAAVPLPANQPPPREFYEAQMSQTFGSKSVTGMAGCKTEGEILESCGWLNRET